MTRTLSISALFALAGVALAGWYWPALPAQMPIHWGPSGQADGFASREAAVMLAPALSLGVPALVAAFVKVDPRQEHVARSMRALGVVIVGLSGLCLWLQLLTLQAAIRPDMALDTGALLVGVGVLFAVVGNALPKFQSNWFAGIRTPWTLQSEAVWHRTHRVGGWCFVGAGILTVLVGVAAPTQIALTVALASMLAASIVPVVYSYVLWSKLGDSAG